jgi:drug/metabolite transporter (DMT)-like permease
MRLWPGVLLVLVGAALGAVSATVGPRLVEPYLPEAVCPGR